jgi:alpha,alpha-trehalase
VDWTGLCRPTDRPYRERTQLDSRWGLWFWDNAMQSGADNNAALSNDPADRSSILAVDAAVFAMREYSAMAVIAGHLGHPDDARRYRLQAAMNRAEHNNAKWYRFHSGVSRNIIR